MTSAPRRLAARRRGAPSADRHADDRRPAWRCRKAPRCMRAAALAGIDIPKLCATDSLEPFGSCRLCLVEIEGAQGHARVLHDAGGRRHGRCTRRRRGSQQLRRGVMELYISDHPLDCLTCAANGDCELQDMAGAVGPARRPLRLRRATNHLGRARKDTSQPLFHLRPVKCIVCSRCVRACEEVQGTFALTIEGRGFDSACRRGQRQLSSTPNASPAAPACRPARPRRCRRRRSSRWARPTAPSSPPAAKARTCQDGPLQARQGEPRPFLRQG